MFMRLLSKLSFFALPLAIATFLVLNPLPAHAAYNESNLIDDSVFLDSNSMSQADIQSFLNSKGGALASYTAPNTDPGQNNRMMSAAEIIYFTSQYIGINPQVIMATLQKEQSLITAPSPSSFKYDFAMGYYCPDSGGCGGSSGFYNQIVNGAWQLRFNYERANGSSASWVSPSGKTWGAYTGYACSSASQYYSTGLYAGRTVSFLDDNGTAYKTFVIANRATASLYCYTPHAYGTTTSPPYAYSGSYNFVTSFESWWGSTHSVQTNWRFEKLDGGSDAISARDSNAGPTPSSITLNSYLYNFYYDVTEGTLRAAINDNATGWSFKSLDGQGLGTGQVTSRVGQFSAPIIYSNQVHVFYLDVSNGDLRHAWSANGDSAWQYETLDGNSSNGGRTTDSVGYSISAAVYNDSIQLFYYDQTTKALRHSWYTQLAGWQYETLEGGSSSVSGYSSDVGVKPAVQVYQNTIQVFYSDLSRGNLRHAWFNPDSGWHFENLDGDKGAVSRYDANVGLDSTAMVYQDTIQAFYQNLQTGSLRHAFFIPGKGWRFEDLDGGPNSVSRYGGRVGTWPSVTSYNNTMQLVYYDSSRASTRHAFFIPGWGWGFDDFDGSGGSLSRYSGNIGIQSTVISYLNTIQAFYLDAGRGDVRHAWFTP